MSISAITRRAIIDELQSRGESWFGRLDPIEFLSRLYDLDALPSHDPRYDTAAGDITQHAINWPNDWEPDWVFTDSRLQLWDDDEKLLAFLAEMLHPEVRPKADEARALAAAINSQLVHDGYELAETGTISGRPIFGAQQTGTPAVSPTVSGAKELNSAYVARQIGRMNEALHKDPELAIGTAKELLETVCKTVLLGLGKDVPDDVPKLVRSALDATPIDVAGAAEPERAERALARLLGNLSGLGSAVAEVRNACGTGHGQHAATADLDPIYARVVVEGTATLINYLAARFRATTAS